MEEELKQALRVIQKECAKHPDSCEGCPLYNVMSGDDFGCLIVVRPDLWKFE